MDILLCEGQNDVWFFHELMSQAQIIDGEIFQIKGQKFSEFQKNVLHDRCFRYISENYNKLIYGDTGKYQLYSQIFPEIVADLLGRYKDLINIFIILDEDGVSYPELKRNIKEVLEELSKNKSRFQVLPTYYEDNEYFFIQSSRTESILKVKLLTIPTSLEMILVKFFVASNNLKVKKYDLSSYSPHDVLKSLADDFFDGNMEKLIRGTVPYLMGTTSTESGWITEFLMNFEN